jgi:hypothetical protein
MVAASFLALEEPTPNWITSPTRSELHEHFDLWLDILEDAVRHFIPPLTHDTPGLANGFWAHLMGSQPLLKTELGHIEVVTLAFW